MKIKIGDIIIALVILVCAILLFSFDFSNGDAVYIEVDGEIINTISIEENTDFVYGDTADLTVDSDSESIYFLNKAYYELPATGGIGTHLYTLGGSLMTAAAVFLLYKRKRERKGEKTPS